MNMQNSAARTRAALCPCRNANESCPAFVAKGGSMSFVCELCLGVEENRGSV